MSGETWRGLEGVRGLSDRLAAWARSEPGVTGLVLFGSLTRVDRHGDDWSDVDAMVLVDDRAGWLSARPADWPAAIAPVWLSFLHPAPIPGVEVNQVLFAGGYDADIVVLDRGLFDAAMADVATAAVILGHGYRVVFDDTGALSAFTPPPGEMPELPDATAFGFAVHTSLFQLVWAVKRWRRGEEWRAVDDLNGYLKEHLLRLLEWSALLDGATVFGSARKMRDWARPDDLAGLGDAYGTYGSPRFPDAVRAHHALLRRVGGKVAARLGFAYPHEADGKVGQWIEDRFAEVSPGAP
ncbi:MAG: aminoglycoside 6-adenylyltransferase [Bauldia sp.]|nr:aminoglycoside 6-adenylyltransferase [Bauldia sp.]